MSIVMILLPGIAAQFVLGFVMIGLFVQTADNVAVWKPILTSLVMVILSLVIEMFLPGYLYQGTIALEWVLFVLLGKFLCNMPLDKAMMAQFCFFSWMLGIGIFQPNIEPPDSEEERSIPEWVYDVEEALLPNRMASIRNNLLEVIYDLPDDRNSGPSVVAKNQPVDSSSSTKNPPDDPTDSEPVAMTGTEFEALFYDASVPPSELVPLAGPAEDRLFVAPPSEDFGNQFEELTPPTTLASTDSEEIVKVQNRSTDPDFTPPSYAIGAVSFGKRGSFAMVDGRLLREGAILRTGTSDPRGWKLHRITETDLFWQPLK